MLRPVIVFLIAILGTFASSSSYVPGAAASAARRIALVVTNANYSGELSKLESPHNDGNAVTAALKAIGFEVQHVRDVSRDAFRAEILAFVKRFETAGEGATSFFYFSGHGAADREFLQNYMLPIGEISAATSLDKGSISLEDVIRPLEAAQSKSGRSFVVLDACRNVPSFIEANPRVTSSFVRRDRVRGMLIGYATDEGQVAADQNYFSNALSSLLPDPELEAVRMFKKVKEQVHQLTAERQTPWYEDGLIGDVFLARNVDAARQSAAVKPPSTPATVSPPAEAERPAASLPPPTLPPPVVTPPGALFTPGQAIITQFSGLKSSGKGFRPVPADGSDPTNSSAATLPDVSGPVVVFADLTRPDQSEPGKSVIIGPLNRPSGSGAAAPVVTAGDIGQVYGAAVDPGSEVATGKPRPADLYLAATSAYGLSIVGNASDEARGDNLSEPQPLERGRPGATWAPGQFGTAKGGGPGAIWKVDGTTGEVKLFAEIALDGIKNRGPGLGQLAYDSRTRQLFVSDRQTGMIHRLSMSGAELGYYDHGVDGRPAERLQPVGYKPATSATSRQTPSGSTGALPVSPEFRPDTAASWGIAADERSVWGLAVFGDRLFYAIAEGPSIWSVGIRVDGTFASDPRREIELSGAPPGSNVPRIDFDSAGNLYLTVLTGLTAVDLRSIAEGSPRMTPSAVLRYRPQRVNGSGPAAGWSSDAEDLTEAAATGDRRPVGAAAIGYGLGSDGRIDLASCGGSLWIAAVASTESSRDAGRPILLGWSGSALARSGEPNHVAPLATYEAKAPVIGSLTMVAPCAAPRHAGGAMTQAGRPPEIRPPRRGSPTPDRETAAITDSVSPSPYRPPGSQGPGTSDSGPSGTSPEGLVVPPPPCMSLAGARFQCIGNSWELDVNLTDPAGKGLDSLKVSSLSPNSLVEPGLQRRVSPADPFRIRFESVPSGSQVPVDVCLFDLAASLSGRRFRCCRAELRVELPSEPCGVAATDPPPIRPNNPAAPQTAVPNNPAPGKP